MSVRQEGAALRVRWRRGWPRGRALAVVRQLGLPSLAAAMEGAQHLVAVSRDRGWRRLVATGQAAVWNGRGQPVAVLVPSWKEARIVRRTLERYFGESRRVGGQGRWQPLEEVRGVEVLVVTYQRFLNYVQFQARCGFYRVVLHEVDRMLESRRLYVVEALLERVQRLRQGFRVCCTARALPPLWVEWFQQRFQSVIIVTRRGKAAPDLRRVQVVRCADSGLEAVIPTTAGRRCLVVPPEAKVEVAAWVAQECPDVTVLGYGERRGRAGFTWVGVDLRRAWSEPRAREVAWSLVAPHGRMDLLVEEEELEVSTSEVVQRFFGSSTQSGGVEGTRLFEDGRAGIAPKQPLLELVLQLVRKVRYWRTLRAVFRSLFLYRAWGVLFVKACEDALSRLMALGLVAHPRYETGSGRVVQAGWLRVSEEGRQLASDFATLEVPEVKTGVRSFSELLECLAEWFDESVVEQLQLVQQWARRGRPPPDRAQPDGRELESLGRLYRSLRYVARVHAVRMPPGWDRIGRYLRLPHPVRREVSDVVAVRRLARRMAVHLLPEESRILGLDVEPWRVFDPRELAHLTGIPVGQATRLLFGYFEDLTPPRKARLQAWARRGWLPSETLEQITGITERLERGRWRRGVGRPRNVLVCRQEGS